MPISDEVYDYIFDTTNDLRDLIADHFDEIVSQMPDDEYNDFENTVEDIQSWVVNDSELATDEEINKNLQVIQNYEKKFEELLRPIKASVTRTAERIV